MRFDILGGSKLLRNIFCFKDLVKYLNSSYFIIFFSFKDLVKYLNSSYFVFFMNSPTHTSLPLPGGLLSKFTKLQSNTKFCQTRAVRVEQVDQILTELFG